MSNRGGDGAQDDSAVTQCEGCGETWPQGSFDDGECPGCRDEWSCQFCGAEATARVELDAFNGPPEDVPACDGCADSNSWEPAESNA